MQTPSYKVCPSCANTCHTGALECARCGHAFRIQINSPYAPVAPVPQVNTISPAAITRNRMIAGLVLMALAILITSWGLWSRSRLPSFRLVPVRLEDTRAWFHFETRAPNHLMECYRVYIGDGNRHDEIIECIFIPPARRAFLFVDVDNSPWGRPVNAAKPEDAVAAYIRGLVPEYDVRTRSLEPMQVLFEPDEARGRDTAGDPIPESPELRQSLIEQQQARQQQAMADAAQRIVAEHRRALSKPPGYETPPPRSTSAFQLPNQSPPVIWHRNPASAVVMPPGTVRHVPGSFPSGPPTNYNPGGTTLYR